jgi:SAM-dependent methyltransferase
VKDRPSGPPTGLAGSVTERDRVDNRQSWDAEADNWLLWARTPGHDAYWYYRDAFFDRIVPPPGRLTLEVGCGEGRVTRDLVERGHTVVSLDGSRSLLGHALAADRSGRYVLADAGRLPLADASVDQVVTYNALMDFDDMAGALSAMWRVLEVGGALSICIVHPMFDAGRFSETGDAYILTGDYFGKRSFEETVTERGLTMTFKGWSYPLEDYFSALTGAGFVVASLREPRPTSGADNYALRARYPMFLHVLARKLPGRSGKPAGKH